MNLSNIIKLGVVALSAVTIYYSYKEYKACKAANPSPALVEASERVKALMTEFEARLAERGYTISKGEATKMNEIDADIGLLDVPTANFLLHEAWLKEQLVKYK